MISVDFNKYYKMAAECTSSANAYRTYIAQLKTILPTLALMKEPSLSVGVEHINALISEMSTSASNLDKIASRINDNLATLKRLQDDVEKAAKKLSSGN